MEEIEHSINSMDSIYDANFGEWIRNENNCKIVGANIKKYMRVYKEADFLVVIKWIVKDWTLKNIITFTKKLITEELYTEKYTEEEDNSHMVIRRHGNQIRLGATQPIKNIFGAELRSQDENSPPPENLNETKADRIARIQQEKIQSKIRIVAGIVFTWNSLFVAEFMLNTSHSYNSDQTAEYYYGILSGLESNKLSEVLLQIDSKTDDVTKDKLVAKFNEGSIDKKRTGSILDAMNML